MQDEKPLNRMICNDMLVFSRGWNNYHRIIEWAIARDSDGMRSILADGLYEHIIIKAFGDFSGSLFFGNVVGESLSDLKIAVHFKSV